jgi:signal transduction histidine kinase
MEQVAGIISKSSYVLNPAILRQLKEVVNAEIVFFDKDGRVFSTTFSDPAVQEMLQDLFKSYSDRPFMVKDMAFGNVNYRSIIHPLILPEQGQAFLSLWMSTNEADRLKAKIIVVMGGIAIFGILAMAGVGYLIARTITAPIEELVKVTGKVSEGEINQRARLNSRDEIGSLADSFNHMIDQLKTYEKRLVESEKMATAGKMAAGLAHEIRNPLTSIKMLGQVLQARLKESRVNQRMLDSLVKEVNRLDRIIQELINRARPGELRMERDDINQQVEEVIRVAGESLAAQGIAVEQELSNHIPEVFMDRERLKQVLWNLLLNAKEAMPKGGQLIVSTRKADGEFVEILVEDTGAGIPSVETEGLFQPFFTTKPEGVGLGLTMSRKIVERHGGELILENRAEGGARARVVIPIKVE